MNVVVDETGSTIGRMQFCPHRIDDSGMDGNIAHTSAQAMIADAIERSIAAGPRQYVPVAWAWIAGRHVDYVGMLRVIPSTREIEFSFFNRAGEDFEAARMASVTGSRDWQRNVIDQANRGLETGDVAVRIRNKVIVRYEEGRMETGLARLMRIIKR